MVDLILVVEDSRAWHEENLERNAGHYSGFGRFMGAGGVAAVQGRGGWFNPYVKIGEGERGAKQRLELSDSKSFTPAFLHI